MRSPQAKAARDAEVLAKKAREIARKQAIVDRRKVAEEAKLAAEAAKIEEKKKQLVDLADVQRELLNATRPATLLEYTRARGMPDDVIYHPRYNFPKCPPDASLQQLESFCFARDWPAEYGGLGAYRHLQNFIRITWPEIQWNEWMERMLRSLCDADYVIRDGGNMVDGGSGSMVRVGGTTLRYVSWVGCGSASKAQPLDAIVYTPSGPKRMGDVNPGDFVCTPNGPPAKVTATFPQHPKQIYRVNFADGSSTRCCGEHLWKITDGGLRSDKIVDTIFLSRFVSKPRRVGKIRCDLGVRLLSNPVEFSHREVSIDPYLLGVLLGDGMLGGASKVSTRLALSSVDPEIIDRVRKEIGPSYDLFQRPGTCDYNLARVNRNTRSHNQFIESLRGYGLWGKLSYDKFVPEDYMLNSVHVRMELLRGLMDTDGHLSRGKACFSSSSEKLSRAVQWIVRSIGGTATVHAYKTSYHYKGKLKSGALSYKVSIRYHTPRDLFFLSRKKAKARSGLRGSNQRIITSVELAGFEPAQCILIDDAEHLYLTDDFIPTHNTFCAGLFACAWFMFDYFRGAEAHTQFRQTSVTLTSTSKGIIAQRVWPVIQKCYHDAKDCDGKKLKWGHLVDSKKMVQAVKGDEKHSICALAVEPGDLQASLDKIKGRHTPRMMVVVDEANSTPQAIFECFPNMLTSVTELIVLVIGNAGSRLDPHGRCCEPKRGWKSISIDDDQWETKGVEQWGIGPGVALHFDGSRSPNVIAGRTEHRFIYSFERWQQVLRMGDEYRNTLQHWSQDRGFWPPDGLQTTVFTEALVLSHDGMGRFDWIDIPQPVAALDTAFGGDDCVYTPGLLGLVRGPKLALQLLTPVLVPFNPDSSDSIDFQIAQWFIARCKRDKVEPQMAGLDSSGTGRGVAAFVDQLWSPRIHKVEFGGSASDLPASTTDPRASSEVYSNRVTELWYACRELLSSDQLRGLGDQAVKEFCSRTYEFISRRYLVEPKKKMKIRLGYSPDYADSTVVMVEVARRNGLKAAPVAGAPRHLNSNAVWDEAQRDVALLTEGDYGSTNEYAAYADM